MGHGKKKGLTRGGLRDYNTNVRVYFSRFVDRVKRSMGNVRTDYIRESDLEAAYRALTYENELVLRVCEETGLRVGDVLAIRTEQLKPRMTVTESKTGKRRVVYVRKGLLAALKANSGRIFVFEGRLSYLKHRTRQAVWKDLKRAAKALRIRGNIAPHSVRKLYAAELVQRGASLQEVQKALNHSSAEVTAIYLMAALSCPEKRPLIKRRRSPNKKKSNEKGGETGG